MEKLNTAKKLIQLLPPTNDSWVIDGGFHKGHFSNEVLSTLPTSNIIAFEPDPDTWSCANDNFNKKNTQLEIVNAALGDKDGKMEFFRGPFSATNSLLPRPADNMKPYYPEKATLTGGCTVNVVTIDNECQKRGIKQLDLLKLDLQGGEILALNGSTSLLKSNAIKVIIIEATFIKKYQNQPLLWEIWQRLSDFGYTLYSLNEIKVGIYEKEESSLRDGQWNQCDAIFVNKQVRHALDQ